MVRSVRSRAIAILVAGAVVCVYASAASGATPAVSLDAAPAWIAGAGTHKVVLTGRVTGAPAGSRVVLYKSPFPYPPWRAVRATITSSDGSFQFIVFPDRNSRYRVVVAGTGAHAAVRIQVASATLVRASALPLGRAGVTILVYHPSDLTWGGASVRWSFATGYNGPYSPAPATRSMTLGPNVLLLSTRITLPAGHFRWRACFDAPQDHALWNPRRPAGCGGRGYSGAGSLPVGFPGPGAIANAASYLAGRAGRKAFAVVDTEGRMSGVNVHWTFPTASVVKAMLLVGYLRRLDSLGQHYVDSFSNSFLYPMIHVSDNNAATQTWSIVGDAGLYSVAAAAGMTDFSVSGLWGTALLSPADQAHFFFEMDSLIPPEFVGYARFLLSTIEPSQSWGIPVIARPLGYQTFFKDGSEPTALGQLVHQIDRLEGHGRTFSIAVMTDGDPTMQYGIDTIQGVAAALLG